MSALLTVEEYLAIDRLAELKSEYHDGVLYPICNVTVNHGRIVVNLVRRVAERLEGGPCFAAASPVRVRINPRKYVYPDLVVVCGEGAATDEVEDTLTNPKVIVEVLSPSTKDYDYGSKFELYRELLSFEEYLLVSQETWRVEVFRRMPDAHWLLSTYDGTAAAFPIESLGFSIPLAEIYSGIL
jgi:Uma2 family endonuclease